MKRYFSCLLVVVLVLLSLVGCNGTGTTAGPTSGPQSTTKTPSSDKEYILVGRVAPLTGPLANFGAGTPYIEEAAVEALNAEGGIYIEEYGKKLPVKFIVVDSESNLTKASEAATKLIMEDKVDVMITSHTADTVLGVVAVCERNGVPCISVDAPLDMWQDGGPYEYCYHSFFNTETELAGFSGAWDILETNGKVGLLCANDTEGTLFAQGMTEIAKNLPGYTVYDPGKFVSGTNDYTEIINKFIAEDIQIITGPVITPDFATFWKQARSMGFYPKISAIDKANLYQPDVMSYGDNIGHGLLTEVWWEASMTTKSSLTGQTSQELADMYLANSNWDYHVPGPIGYKHANVELLVDALQRAKSLEPKKITAALDETSLDTIIGHIEYDEGNACVLNIAIGQWTVDKDGKWSLDIVSNKHQPLIPMSDKKPIPIPGS
jgi:branched-chain amino acid transport system substrate-binding protein